MSYHFFLKKKNYCKIIAFVLIELITFYEPTAEIKQTDRVEIPTDYGSIKEYFEGNSASFVVHIQDTHTNYSAQKNLAKILQHLAAQYNIHTVGIEGSSGRISTTEFERFPDKRIKQEVANIFLKDGKIDGSEYLSIVENSPDSLHNLNLYGIENHTLYRQNLSAFLHSLPYQHNLIAFCNSMSENIEKLKPHIYSKELLAFDKLTEDFHNNRLDFVQYCEQLLYTADENLVDRSFYINLNKIVFLTGMEENISFDKIEEENHSAIKELSILLTHDQSREMLEKEFSFRTKKIAPEVYYRFLHNLFVQYNLSTARYPNLQQYILYLTEYRSVNQTDALSEADSLTEKVYSELIGNDTQQTLHDIGHYIRLMSNFCRLKMTRHYIDRYHRYRNTFPLDDCIRFLKKQGIAYHESISADYDLPSIHATLANFEDFYAIAHQREQALVDNLLSLSARGNSDTIVCVAGGFHTDGITSLLKSKDISYIVITPNTIHDEPPIPYISLLQNIRTPLEQMLTTQTSTLKIASWLTENMPLAYEERKTMLSVKLKTLLTATKLHDLYQTALRTYTPSEQIILKSTIENQLKDSINNVIKIARYENILSISAVHLTPVGLMAEIRFPKSPTPLFVGYSTTAETSISQHALLETVNLPSGIAEHFFGSTELFNVTTRYTQERSRILSVILDNAYTFDQLHSAINVIRARPYMNTATLRSYIEVLNAAGIIAMNDGTYTTDSSESARTAALLAIELFNDAQEISGIIRQDSAPPELKELLNRRNIGSLFVEPALSVESLVRLSEVILDDSVSLHPGSSIDLAGTAYASIIQPAGNTTLVVQVMPVSPLADTDTPLPVSSEIEKQFKLPLIDIQTIPSPSIAPPLDIMQEIDDFNLKNHGIFSIAAQPDYIATHAGELSSILRFFTTPIQDINRIFQNVPLPSDETDESRTRIVSRRLLAQTLENLLAARQLWMEGKRQNALTEMDLLPEQLRGTAIPEIAALSEPLQADIERLHTLESAESSQIPNSIFNSFDAVVSVSLGLLPNEFYVPARFRFATLMADNIEPFAGITDIVMHFQTELAEDIIADEELRQQFSENGIAAQGRHIYLNLPVFLNSGQDIQDTLNRTVGYADEFRREWLNDRLSLLEELGFPADIRLLAFMPLTLESAIEAHRLPDGFRAKPITLESKDYGIEIPVALPPHRYNDSIDTEIQRFNNALSIIDEAARALAHDNNPLTARNLLIQAEYLITNLHHFTPSFRKNFISIIHADIAQIDREFPFAQRPTGDMLIARTLPASPLVPALFLYGIPAQSFIIDKTIIEDTTLQQLLTLAFEEISSINSSLSTDIQSNMTIVIGTPPEENAPFNTIYIPIDRFEYIRYLAGKESTLPVAASMLAGFIADIHTNSRQLAARITADELRASPESYLSYIQHTQQPIPDAAPDFSGEISTPLEITYDAYGKPLVDFSGPRTITTFENGVPIKVWNTKTGEEHLLPPSGLDVLPAGESVTRDANDNLISLLTLSPLEKWVGMIQENDQLYFLEKDNVIVALVKSRDGEHSIFPLHDGAELTSLLNVPSFSQAMNTLRAMAESYDQLSDDLEKSVPEPVKQAKAKRRRFVQFIHPNIIIIPFLLLSCTGCVVHQQTPVQNPYTERSELFDRPELSEQDLTSPYDLTPFIGTTGDSSFDRRVAEDFIEDTIRELEELRSDLQEQVTRLRSEGQPDQTRIQSLEYRIGLLTATIENLRIEAENIPSSDQFITPAGQPDLSAGSPYQPGAIVPTPIPGGQAVPQELLTATRSILAEPFTQRSIQTLEAFNSGLIHRSGQFNGTVRSYDGDEAHPDYSYLVSHGRVTPYDISVSIFADLVNGDYPLARQKVSGLLRIMHMESEAGFNGVIHFNYNTEDDSYVNPQAPLGNTAWTLKAIYGYILATGDRSILTGQNGQLIQNGMDFVISQQVMIETDPRYGLFRAGLSSVNTDGYGVMESVHNQYEHVVTEHLTDIHDLLNLAYQVSGNTLYQERRLLLDRQTLETLLVETDTTAYFLPNITAEGTPGSGVAIDDLTWAGSMVLTMDHLPLERRLELVQKLIQYVDDNFIVEHDPTMDTALPVQLTDQYIAQRSQISSTAIVGVKFFDGFFEDDFIAGMDWDNPAVMSVQVEATLGYVHLLYQAASLTPDTAEQQRYIARIEFLMDNVQQFYDQHSRANGIPYSTRNIENIQTTLDATIASETYRAVLGIWNHPERMWSFIGIPQSSRTANQINTGFQDESNQIVPAFPPEPVYVQPDNTFVFIANPFLESHIIYPSGRPGIQPSEELPFPTFTDQIQQDVRALIEYLSSFSVTGESFSPASVENWEGSFIQAPQWTAQLQAVPQLSQLTRGETYTAHYSAGNLAITLHQSISTQRLSGIDIQNAGDQFFITIEGNRILLQPALTAEEVRLYGNLSSDIQQIYQDIVTTPMVFNRAQFPEFDAFETGTRLTAYSDSNRENLLVTLSDTPLAVDASAIFGDSFFAPQNTSFQIQVDEAGTVTASENIDLVSIYQNPWTPNIPMERLAQFMAGLQRTGHTRLFVDTQPLVNGYTIQEQSAREYYTTLIQLARREGIQVYATQGNPAWITPAGISTAQTYLYTLGNTAVDFDGYVLNIQADRLPQWSQLSETERPLFAAHYSDVIAQFEETIRSFSGHNRTIFSTVPLAIHATEGYTPNTALSDILIITGTTADDIVARIAEYNPTQPFHVQIETSLLDQAQTTFALREDRMPSVLEDVAQQLRQHPQYGTLFSGFVINHDTGEDILHVMEHGTGRDAGDRMRDGLRTDSDIPIMLTQNLYNMVVFGSSPEVLQTGEETPSSWEVIQAQLRSRLQGTLRGITGAANVDHMVNSLIETVNRDRFTILPEAIPFGAEFGTGLAASTFIWGQQYSEMAAIHTVTIEGLNEDGIVVDEWNDVLNSPFPIIIGQNSAITNLRFSVNIESGAQQNQTFPGYLVLLTHHPQNGGIVTETSSDQFNLPAGDSTTIEFTVPVSAEGINNFGFMLMNGQKYSDREVVVDRVGIGHRYGIIADWIQSHVDEYPIYYSDAVAQSSELEINRLGLWSGVVDSRVVVNTFELEHFDLAQPQTQQTIELLAESGVRELTLDGTQFMEMMRSAPDVLTAKRQITAYFDALRENNIRVSLLVGDESWIDNEQAMQDELFPLFRLQLGFNGFILNLGAQPDQVNLSPFEDFIRGNSGYTDIATISANELNIVQNPETIVDFVDNAITARQPGVTLVMPDFVLVRQSLDAIPSPSSDELIVRARQVNEETLEYFALVGHTNLSRSEQTLMDFSQVRTLPPIQLGEAAAFVQQVTPENIFVEQGETPYITFDVTYDGNRSVATFTSIVRLTSITTGETIEDTFPIHMSLEPGFRTQRINIPIAELAPGQWRYDVTVIPSTYERGIDFRPATPLLPEGSTVQAGSQDITVFLSNREGTERRVEVGGNEFFLLSPPNAQPGVRIGDEFFPLPEIRTEGVRFELGPSNIRVNVSQNPFGEWAIETGGEEVTITAMQTGEEALMIGIPQHARTSGFIQQGLPEISVRNVDIDVTNPFIFQQESTVIPVQLDTSFQAGDYGVLLTAGDAGMIEIQLTAPNGEITRQSFPAASSERVFTLGNRLLILGTNADNALVAVVAPFASSTISFEVSNSADATSPARYIPEVSFYHPVVGELSISSDNDYVIQPGETRTITMDLPIPIDFLANEKLELSVIRNEIRSMQSSYADFISEQQRLQALESIPANQIETQIQQRFETLRDTLPGYIQTLQSLIRQVQGQNMISETHQAGIVNLQDRLTALDELLARIDTVSPDEFSFLLTDIVIEFQNVRTALSDLSTQLYGYRVSIHDVSNLLGEPVYAHFIPFGQDATVQAPVPVIRDVVIDPVLGRTEQQVVRRIGKAPYAQIVLGVVTPAVIQETHQAYVANYLDLRQSQLQLAGLVHDYYRALEYNIPSSQFAVDNAQRNIELASSERDRSQTVGLTGVFFENINLLKTADIRGGEAHILHYAEIVQEGETLIYDSSTEILASLLADLDADISLAPRADAVRFLEDLVSLFGLLDEDITTDEALLHVRNFLAGANSTDIQHAEDIVRTAMQDDRLEGRQRAAFIISHIVTEPSVREYLLHLSFSRMADQLDEEQTQAEQISNPTERERELARIRGLRAYMGLVIERNAAEDLLEQARTNHQLGIDPTAQAAGTRLAFQRALGHFQIIIGLETEFRPVTDLNDLIERIQVSSLNPEDKQHAVEVLQQITENLEEFRQFLSRRQQAIDGAEQSLVGRQTDVQEANDLLAHLSELRAGHELFIERLDRSVAEQTTHWQNAIRQIPPDQALPFIEEVIQLELNNLTSYIRDLQRAHQNREYYQGIIDSNTEQIAELRQRHSASDSQVERQIIIASRIHDLELSSLEASAELEFFAWHMPYLETQITSISGRITELQGAQLVLGGTPDTTIFNDQIRSITTQLSPLHDEATSLNTTIAGLSSYQSELESDYQTLLDRYNYPQRMRAVGEQIELSTSLTELNLINNPDSYFQFLKHNGISHVYIPISEITDAQGNIDIGRLTYAGRIIQAAQQNDIRVSITLTIDFDWQTGELGDFDVDAATALFRLFQQRLFQYNVRINGFAIQLTPYTGTTTPTESVMDSYRDARQDIAEVISEESDDVLDAIRDIITAERDAGRFDTADAMEQTLSQMLDSQGTLTYTFEVFESQQLASSIEYDLQTRFGVEASEHRTEEYPGTSIIRSTSSSVPHIRGIDAHLQTTPHGIGIDWSTSTAQGQQERLPELIESIHTYAQTQPGGLSSIFIESDNVYALQRNLNALGAVPLYALDLLQTEADLQTAYNQRVLSYVQGLNGQLENLRSVLDAEQEFRDSSQSLIDEIGRIPDEGLVLEIPDFLLGEDVQLSQLQQRLSDLETRISLRMTMEEADALAADIDQLYEDMSANIRRLRISLSALFTPSGFQIPGVTGINSFGQAQSLFSGNSTISFDFGQLLPSGSPVGFSISYRTSDGRQEQRDLLREHENIRTSVTHLRDAAYQFAEFSAQIDAMGLQLQRDYTDVTMLRRGIDLASRPEAQTTPHTFIIGGQEVVIQGNIIVALRSVSTALESATTRESTLAREIASLENTIATLRQLHDQAPSPDTSATFLTRDLQPQESIVSLDYAVTNRDLAQAQYEQAVRGQTIAQTEYDRALGGLQDARTSIQTAANNISLAQNAVEETREQVEQAFLDLLTALAGTNITRDQLYDTQVGGIGVRLRLDQSETGLQQAYFNFDTIFHRIFNLIESTSTEAQFEAYFRGYETDRILPGWGLDAVLGPGAPFTGNRDIEAATTAQVIGSVLQPPVSLSLYGGFINVSLSYTSPNFINIGLNLSSAGDSRIGQAELNLLNRQSQFILTNMAEADRQEQVEQAVVHFETMMENYNESIRMLEWRQINLEQAGLHLESVVTDWEQARDFLHRNTRELELAQQNLEQRQQSMISARQTVEEIERAANDEITRDEMQGEMVHQTPPEIIPESESTTITTPEPNRGEEFERARILNQVLARIFYAFLAWLFLLFGKDSIRRIIRKRSLSKINAEKETDTKNIRKNRTQQLSPSGPATHFYTKNKIDRIFRDFTPESPEELKTFLEYFTKNPRALPTQVSLFSNPIFKAVRQFEQSSQRVFEALSQLGNQSGLSIVEVLRLQTILEKTNFVNPLSLSNDIIVLDFDTLGLSSIENAANEEHRRILVYYFESLKARFSEFGRTPHIVIFSESRPSWELPSVLGGILAAHVMQFYGIELFDSFEQSRENRYHAFFATVATHYDVNRVNLKVFSNRQDIMDSAQSTGAILANREGTVFDALALFANLHPHHVANLLIKGTDSSTETFLQNNPEGYSNLAGKELQLRQPAPGRLRTIIPQNLIDSAA